MTRNTILGAVLIAALGAVPLLAHGQGQPQRQGQAAGGRGEFGPGRGRGPGGPGRPGGPGGPDLLRMVHQLDLSDAQKQQIEAIMQDARPDGDAGAAVRQAEQKLHAAVLADTPDLGTIDNLKAVLNSAHSAELEHRVATMIKVAQVLTPAQRQQLLNLRPQRGGRGH